MQSTADATAQFAQTLNYTAPDVTPLWGRADEESGELEMHIPELLNLIMKRFATTREPLHMERINDEVRYASSH